MKYAIINELGLVINVVIWDGNSSWSPPEGTQAILIPDNVPAGIGWSYINGNFVEPQPEPEI